MVNNTPGAKDTLEAIECMSKPSLTILHDGLTVPSGVAKWLQVNPHIWILSIAGNRESQEPGIGARVKRFLAGVLQRLGYKEVSYDSARLRGVPPG